MHTIIKCKLFQQKTQITHEICNNISKHNTCEGIEP